MNNNISKMSTLAISTLLLFNITLSSALPVLEKYQDETCQEPADIVFVVDSSYSIYPRDFNTHMKQFVNHIVSSFKVGPGSKDTRVGLMTFSNRAYLEFYLKSYKTEERVHSAVNRTRFRGGDTYTHKALAFASRVMFSHYYGSREGVAQILVILTDGKSVSSRKTAIEAQKLKAKGVEIFAIGVGPKVDVEELSAMSSGDGYTFQVEDFAALDTIQKRLTNSTCEAIKTTTPAPTTPKRTSTTPTTTTTTPTTTTTTPTTTTTTPTTTTTTPTTTTTTPTTTTPTTTTPTTTTTTPTTTTPTTTTTTPTTTTPTTATTTVKSSTTPPKSTHGPKSTLGADSELPQGDAVAKFECRGKPADIYFLLDASSSVYIVHFHDQVLGFVRDLVSSFRISPRHTRVGVVTFSNDVDHAFGLSEYTDMESLKQAINPDTVEYLTGGTNTGDAIKYVTNKFSTSGARPGVAQIIITVTDGLSQKPAKTAKAAADARQKGIYMFAVGVGNYTDDQELMDISSNPDEDFVFSVDNFEALDSITELMSSKTCKAVANKDKDNVAPPLNQIECSSQPTNIIFTFTSRNTEPNNVRIINEVISEFSNDLKLLAPHVKVGVVSQPCVGGTMSLMDVRRFQSALSLSRSNSNIGYSGVIRNLRTEIFSKVPRDENRVTIMFVDDAVRDLEQLQEEVRKLRFNNVHIIVVAVGNVKQGVLNNLVSLRTGANVFRVDSYATLASQKLPLFDAVCSRPIHENELTASVYVSGTRLAGSNPSQNQRFSGFSGSANQESKKYGPKLETTNSKPSQDGASSSVHVSGVYTSRTRQENSHSSTNLSHRRFGSRSTTVGSSGNRGTIVSVSRGGSVNKGNNKPASKLNSILSGSTNRVQATSSTIATKPTSPRPVKTNKKVLRSHLRRSDVMPSIYRRPTIRTRRVTLPPLPPV